MVLWCTYCKVGEFTPSNHIQGWQPYNVRTLYGTMMYVWWIGEFASSNHIRGQQPYNVRTLFGTMVCVCASNFTIYTLSTIQRTYVIRLPAIIKFQSACILILPYMNNNIIQRTYGIRLPAVNMIWCCKLSNSPCIRYSTTQRTYAIRLPTVSFTAGSRITYIRCIVL